MLGGSHKPKSLRHQSPTLGNKGSLRKIFEIFIWMTISYVKMSADSVETILINLTYDIFSLLV